MKTTSSLAQMSSAALLFAVASSANAFQTFTYADSGLVQSTTGAATAAQTTSNASITTTLQAFANTGGAAFTTPNATIGPSANPATNTFQAQQLLNYANGSFNNFGISSNIGTNQPLNEAPAIAPNHAIDNQGAQEFVLLHFNTAVALTDVSIGWPDSATGCGGGANAGGTCDTDLTVLAYKGAGTLASTMSTQTANSLVQGANFARFDVLDVGTAAGIQSKTIGNSSFITSQDWLVGAYNVTASTLGDNLFDYIKLVGVGGCAGGGSFGTQCGGGGTTPEPSSLALLSLGMLGGIRRWKAKKAAA